MLVKYIKHALSIPYKACCFIEITDLTPNEVKNEIFITHNYDSPNLNVGRQHNPKNSKKPTTVYITSSSSLKKFKSSSKGNSLAFDLILAPPCSPKSLVRRGNGNLSYQNSNDSYGILVSEEEMHLSVTNSPKCKTRDDIENKLRLAEEKRKSIEHQLKEQWKEKETRIKEMAAQSKEATLLAKVKIDDKMKHTEEKRSSQIRAIQDKLKLHEQHVMDVCQASENFGKVVKEKLDKRIQSAQNNRTSVIQSLIERLKEHEQKVEEVKRQNDEMRQEMDHKMKLKMASAITNREEQLSNIRLRIKEHVDHVEEVRSKNSKSMELQSSFHEDTNGQLENHHSSHLDQNGYHH
ncbi:centromere protein F-like isoform X2 [Gordionus sp. m RMFG-2023]|uniref:centromere protein F-like isoform X2 n=1 Tax=Gordionus sp. m RMFG-2023 TaxID=3053472 RepID=UPI0031FC479F